MPQINFTSPGADGPLASLEVGAKYDTTYFPGDLAESPYFIIFRAQNKYKLSELGTVKTKFTGITDYAIATFDSAVEGLQSLTTERRTRPEDAFAGPPAPDGSRPGESSTSPGNLLATGIKAVGGFGKALEKLGIELSQPAHSFALPIPSNLSTQYNAQYNNAQELGALGQVGRSIAGNFEATGEGFISDLNAAISNSNALPDGTLQGILANLGVAALGADVGTSALVGGLTKGVGGAAVAGALGSLGTGVLRGAGIARNPHIANIFTGVNFRNHNFSYKLIAKNKKESDTIRDLIRNFKYHMAPDYRQADHIFTYPSQFQIIIRAGDYLFKIADSVLTTFDVNYTGEGAPYFFEDSNAPYSVTINMSFVEDTIVTKREVRAGR